MRPLCVLPCVYTSLLILYLSSTRFRRDERTWRHRINNFHWSWKPLIGGMVDAYLHWKYPDSSHPNDLSVTSSQTQDAPPPPQSLFTTSDPSVVTPSLSDNNPSLPQAPGPTHDRTATETPSPSTEVELLVIDIYTLSMSVKISCTGDQTTASTLAGLGFIGNAPFHPSVAVSIKTLELYRILCRRKPSLSVEAFVKVVSDLYMVCILFIISTFSHYNKGSVLSQIPSIILRCI